MCVMHGWEIGTLAYAAFLAAAAIATRLPRARRAAALGLAAGLAVAVPALRAVPPVLGGVPRALAPALILLLAYRASGVFFTGPMSGAERALLRLDRWVFARAGSSRLRDRAPRLALEALELAYLMVYPLIPIGAGVLLAGGFAHEIDRFWNLVLVASLPCYATLPFLQTRPPRVIETAAGLEPRPLAVRRLNLTVLSIGSIQVNTIPSGHAASALAVALGVLTFMPGAGLAFLVAALAIALASVIGRYHYALDSIAGLALALVVWWLLG
jgi:membrane-associated phospholipid phosphatase